VQAKIMNAAGFAALLDIRVQQLRGTMGIQQP
jgi:hypothetical protein